MKKRIFTLALFAIMTAPAFAGAASASQEDLTPLLLVQDACTVKGQQLADQRGATLVGASMTADGQCEVVLLIPARDGKRPVREVITTSP